MRSILKKGQFRYVCDSGEECSVWQCLWCLNTFELRDDPDRSKWNFCPRCGRSWFKKLECRDHHIPRWYYDRWGNDHVYKEKVKTFSGEMRPIDIVYKCNKCPQETSEWVIEVRSRWYISSKNEYEAWSHWEAYQVLRKHPTRPDYLSTWRTLRYLREDNDDLYCQHEYRARLRKKNLTPMKFVI